MTTDPNPENQGPGRRSSRQLAPEFTITPTQLSELHNPKSLAAYCALFGHSENGLCDALKTDKKNGLALADEEVRETARCRRFGANRVPERTARGFLRLMWEAFKDKTMIVLMVAAVISFSLGLYEAIGQPPELDDDGTPMAQVDYVEGLAIMAAVAVVVLVTAANDYQKERQFARLNRKKEDTEVVVVRNGDKHVISVHDLLVGDLLSLQTGDVVPVDCILVEGKCECDESGITGESDTIKKVSLAMSLQVYRTVAADNPSADIGSSDNGHSLVPDPMLISGSKLLSGIGHAVVTAVGPHSVHGKMMLALKSEPETTPLQERLNTLADDISIYGSVAAFLLFVVLFLRFLSYLPKGRLYHDLPSARKGSRFMDIFITAVTVIVVAVPEGLPLAVTLALAFATTRMTKDGNLVRVLRACETMGSATTVCSDKTGTLTQNKMVVVKGFLGSSHFDDISEDSNCAQSDALRQDMSQHTLNDILANIALNSTAFENKQVADPVITENPYHKPRRSLFPWSRNNKPKYPAPKDSSVQSAEFFIGSKTEAALLSLAKGSLGLESLQALRDDPHHIGIASIVQMIPFESSRKWAGLVVRLVDGNYRFFIKGASETIFKSCHYMRSSNDDVIKLSPQKHGEIFGLINNLASDALRTISLAHKDFTDISSWPPAELRDASDPSTASPDLLLGDEYVPTATDRPSIITNNNSGLILDGVVGIHDPLRPGVKESVKNCQQSGVTVRMITGDNITTGRAIARACGILSESEYADHECAMEGPVFRKLSRRQMMDAAPKLKVLARSSPEDKRIFVDILKKMNEVVAVTGDGTNDAPALTLADVGFSMGISGTGVAREASDIILMTDDFTSIVNAIKWGRCVSLSIKKFIQFQLTVNITAVTLTCVTAVTSTEENPVLTAVQLLWVNLIMDTLAALALATDKPDPHILERIPTGRDSPLIAVSTWKMILGQAVLQLIIAFVLHYGGRKLFYPHQVPFTGRDQKRLDTLTFNTFVWLQFFKLIVTRKLDEADGISDWRKRITARNLNFFQDLGRNYYFLTILLLIGICQVLIMCFGGAAFSIEPLTPGMWVTSILCGMLSIPWGALIRICPDEWALKLYPKRLMHIIQHIFGLKFLRGRKKSNNEDMDSHMETSKASDLMAYEAFEKARSEMLNFKESSKSGMATYLNPVNIIRKWSHESSDYQSFDDEHSLIASLTMVPTLVGGAVGGFSHISTPLLQGSPTSAKSSAKTYINKDV
ncbi:AFL011Wp [Eremothecium gossypii ATCC 10895]|uniref:Calcium-transporting ATPase n=1 Tax=Eremothecium gossypii (strain ATCC 10895 / CBS 109.51 / FGSC 9923 / NRRL Y-1056) TaxID=284811 RepID=Q754T2_EREGS|nr:AFL011Wp [Eremothecium gossypii ATCC 10895]AAS53361.1 AFL011Wp [Eremothecium gossypii ATCC 10895]